MDGPRDATRTADDPVAGGSIDAAAFTDMLLAGFDAIQEQSDRLSELDRAIGDGDHGTTMARATSRIRARLTGPDAPASIGGVLRDVGAVFLDLDGGATGPLFGTFFMGMAKAAGDHERVDARLLATILESGLASVRGLTSAVPGDKTLMDALVPAVDAVAACAERGESLFGELDACAQAAEAGALQTADLQARHGRAKHLGDRVVGHEDPGARSIAIFLRGLASACPRVLTTEG